MIHKPPPLNRDLNGDPNIKALKRKGFINHGCTLVSVLITPKPHPASLRSKQGLRPGACEESGRTSSCASRGAERVASPKPEHHRV